MHAKDVRHGEKNVTDWGKWASGRMPRTAFPMSKARNRAYRLGSAYRWRIVKFEAQGEVFRLLIAVNLAKEQYRALLGLEVGSDMALVASYEFHGTHPGWHLLTTHEEVKDIPPGVMRGPWQRRFPRARTLHRNTEFGILDDDKALDVAANFFRLHKKPGALI